MTVNNGTNSPGALHSSRSLNFYMQKRSQTNWSWAAIAVSMKQFYEPGSMDTQCMLATKTFMANCCGDGLISCLQPHC